MENVIFVITFTNHSENPNPTTTNHATLPRCIVEEWLISIVSYSLLVDNPVDWCLF
ncbi:unnamed protein product, partial [Vitis vinifera]